MQTLTGKDTETQTTMNRLTHNHLNACVAWWTHTQTHVLWDSEIVLLSEMVLIKPLVRRNGGRKKEIEREKEGGRERERESSRFAIIMFLCVFLPGLQSDAEALCWVGGQNPTGNLVLGPSITSLTEIHLPLTPDWRLGVVKHYVFFLDWSSGDDCRSWF